MKQRNPAPMLLFFTLVIITTLFVKVGWVYFAIILAENILCVLVENRMFSPKKRQHEDKSD